MIGKLYRTGDRTLFNFGAIPDLKNSAINIAVAQQSGLSLPDRDYYLKPDDKSKQIREQFARHAAQMFQLIGEDETAAKADANVGMVIRTCLTIREVSLTLREI